MVFRNNFNSAGRCYHWNYSKQIEIKKTHLSWSSNGHFLHILWPWPLQSPSQQKMKFHKYFSFQIDLRFHTAERNKICLGMWGKKYPIDEMVLLARLDTYTIPEYTGRKKSIFWGKRRQGLDHVISVPPSLSTSAPAVFSLLSLTMIEPHRIDSQTSVSLELKSSKTESPPCPFGSLNFGYTRNNTSKHFS